MPLPVGWEEVLGCRGGDGPSGMLGTPYHCTRGPTWGQWSAVLVRLVSVNVSLSSVPTLSGTLSLFRNSVL